MTMEIQVLTGLSWLMGSQLLPLDNLISNVNKTNNTKRTDIMVITLIWFAFLKSVLIMVFIE
jgi:hypothetical protein